MKILFGSDLHCDTKNQGDLPKMEGDLLVVAGDISNSAKRTARELNNLSANFTNIVFVDGNHEHYSNNFFSDKNDTIENNLKYLDSLLNSNVMRLDSGKRFNLEKYSFVGTNGWYSSDFLGFTPEENKGFWVNYMNDYKYIYEKGSKDQLLPHFLAEKAALNLSKDIKDAISEDLIPIVVTHTVPCEDLLDRRPWDLIWERASGFYLNSNFTPIIYEYGSKIGGWIYGHTHQRLQKNINGIEFYCNPRGYFGEHERPWKAKQLKL